MASAYFRLLIGIQLKFAYFSLNQFQLHNQHHHHHHFLVVNLILLGKLYCGRKFFCFSLVLIDISMMPEIVWRNLLTVWIRLESTFSVSTVQYNYCANFRDRKGESCKLVIPTVARSNALIHFPANTAIWKHFFRHVLCKSKSWLTHEIQWFFPS